MADNRYDIDSLLAEIRRKKAELEGNEPEPAEEAGPEESTVPSVTSILDSLASSRKEEAGEASADAEEVASGDAPTKEVPDLSELRPDDNGDTGETGAEEPEEDPDRVKNLRSVSEQLTGGFDAATTEYTGEFVIGQAAENEVTGDKEEDAEEAEDTDFTRSGVEDHPLFREKTASFNVIPQLDEDQIPESAKPEEDTNATGSLRLDEKKKGGITQGILNLKEGMDDNFRELFGDTVVVEHKDSKKQNRRRLRVEEINNLDEDTETEMDENPDALYELLGRRITSSVIACVVTAVAAAVIIAFAYISYIKAVGNGRTTSIVTAVCMAAAIIVNWKTVFPGIAGMFTSKPALTSLAGFSSLLALAEPVVCILTDAYPAKGFSAVIASVTLLMCDIGTMLKAFRDNRNFRTVSENPQKYASTVVTDQSVVQMLSNDLPKSSTGILISHRTGYTDRFADYCDTDDADFNKTRKVEPFAALICIALGVISYFAKGLTAAEAVRVSALAAAISAPFMSSLMFELPISKLQLKLNRMGAVVPGYAAAEDVASANCVVLEGRELFPREKVLLHGIKTFEKERIDQAILYAASVLIHSCDTMSHMFLKVIQGKTDMLFDTDSVVYEEGLGFSFWVDQNRILVGRREMLESHDIEVPSRDYEDRYTKSSTRDAIYLAVAGKLYAMFVVGYSPDEEMKRLLDGLVKNDISIIVRTRDFIISPEKISRMYEIPQSMVTMVRDSSMQELARMTEYTIHSPSSLTHVGSVGAFLRGQIGCNDLISGAETSSVVGLAGMAVGTVLAAVLALVGGLDTVSILSVAMFQVIWSIIHLIVIAIK
ncbi:MAG: hypothetical protein IKZ75_00150 [Oscillospiraceae bacterium]|nr:hypothetical protein [Oscillospiraceae bacterium]